MHIAGAHQSIDVWLMRLWGHGITKEDNDIDFTLGQARTDLQVAAPWAAEHAFHVQAGLIHQPAASGSRGAQFASLQQRRELLGKCHHGIFFVVMVNGLAGTRDSDPAISVIRTSLLPI